MIKVFWVAAGKEPERITAEYPDYAEGARVFCFSVFSDVYPQRKRSIQAVSGLAGLCVLNGIDYLCLLCVSPGYHISGFQPF